MNELVERYVHQVGRRLNKGERAEIEKELRSLIQDQLDDRYGGEASEAEVAAVLLELGDPRKMAASYSRERYLVGPMLYPTMMRVLQQGWLLVPTVVVLLSVLEAVGNNADQSLVGLFFEALVSVVEFTLYFSAVVVLIFALMERNGMDMNYVDPFDPLKLPPVDDPGSFDRFEVAFGQAFGTFVALVFLYFLSVGGLTLRFNLSEPGDVIPVAREWLALMVVVAIAQVVVHLVVMRRNRWNVPLAVTQLGLEMVGAVALYYALLLPVQERLLESAPHLANIPFVSSSAAIVAVFMTVTVLLDQGRLVARLVMMGRK